eukprot:s223_g18.t1
MSPQEQTKCAGAKPKNSKKKKKPAADDDDDDDEEASASGDDDACSSGGTGYRGRGKGRGRGRAGRGAKGRGKGRGHKSSSPRPSATKRKGEPSDEDEAEGPEQDEPSSPKTKKTKKGSGKAAGKGGACASAKAKARANPKAAAKGSPKAKAKGKAAKSEESPAEPGSTAEADRAREQGGKRKAETKAKAKAKKAPKSKGGTEERSDKKAEQMARASRKSSAYHKTKAAALKAGKTPEEAAEEAKKVSRCEAGYAVATYDRVHGESMDMTGNAGAPFTALQSTAPDESIPGDVAGKKAVALGSFKASSQDAQRDPLMWADSQATLRMGSSTGDEPKAPNATPTKNLIRMGSPPVKKGKGQGTPSIKAPANPELGLYEKLLKHHSPSKSGSKKRHREREAHSPVDDSGFLLGSDIPTMSASAGDLIGATGVTATDNATVTTNASTASFKNLGSDGLSDLDPLRLKDQLSVLLATMKKNYKLLTEKQSESLNGACDKSMMKRGPSSNVGGAKAKAKTKSTPPKEKKDKKEKKVKKEKKAKHSFTTRLLFAVVPSEYYASRTLEVLHRALVEDWLKLYEEGLTVSWDVLCNSAFILLVRARGLWVEIHSQR